MSRAERTAYLSALVALLLLAIPVAFRRIACVDLPWQLAAGHQILESGRVPTVDRFALLSLDRAWLDVHWLAQLLLALLERAGGLVLLQIATVVVLWAALLGAIAAVPRAGIGRALAVPVAMIAVLASWQRIEPRPDILSMLFPALLLRLLDAVAEAAPGARQRGLVALAALLQILWTNLHGSFVLGVFMTGLALAATLASRAERKAAAGLATAFAAIVAATLVNPRGVLVWQLFRPYVEAVAGRMGARFAAAQAAPPPIQEWLPSLGAAARPYLASELPWYLALLALAAVALVFGGARLALRRSLQLALFAVLSLAALRNIPPFAFLAVAVLPPALAAPLEKLAPRRRALLTIPLLLLTTLAALTLAWGFATNRYAIHHMLPAEVGPGLHPTAFPEGPAGWVEAAAITGQAFHNYDMGGYWIWRFQRQKLALLDGRLDLLAPDQLERYVAAMADPATFERFARETGVSHIVLSFISADARILVPYLEQARERWRRAYADETGVLYLPAGVTAPAVVPRRRPEHPADTWAQARFARLERHQRRLPLDVLNRAILEEAAGYRSLAASYYEQALERFPGVGAWHVRLTLLHWQLGDAARARRHLDWLQHNTPEDPALVPLRAMIQGAVAR